MPSRELPTIRSRHSPSWCHDALIWIDIDNWLPFHKHLEIFREEQTYGEMPAGLQTVFV